MSGGLARFAVALVVLAILAPPAAAHSPTDPPAASLDGEPSDVASATLHHCHDLDPSTLTCFRAQADRDSAANVRPELVSPTNTDASVLSLSSNGYLIAWEFIGYGGGSVLLSQDYIDLTSIGWNDRISSYKVYTTLTGAFYQHSYYSGQSQYFCCNVKVSSLGSLDNQFSSLNMP